MSSVNRLEMRAISIRFSGFAALDQVDFSLAGGSIHGLTGANGAGKSTLMAVLSGTHAEYRGKIEINGAPVTITSPRQARRYGIHLVQQEVDVALVPGLSVAENIMLDQLAEPGFFHSWRQVREQAAAALAQLDMVLDLDQSVERCTLAQKQHILLARALSHHCRFLILDEPTAPLDQQESERLFAVAERLKQSGIGLVFISHRLHELRAICDQITVLRDGRLVDTCAMASLTNEAIVEKMLGHGLDQVYPPRRTAPAGEPLLQVEGLHDHGLLRDISFTLRRGEILGFAGLAGAGKSELCKALFGASRSQVRQAWLNGKPWQPDSPVASVRQGLALVPEERRKEGIFIDGSIAMNLSVCADQSFSRYGLFAVKSALAWAHTMIERLGIRARTPAQSLRRLSGGNQQKVAIGKWLRGPSDLLIFDEPTKGVDVSAKTDLFHLIDTLAREGKGIIYASGEFAELVGLCDRICILFDGKIVAELDGREAKEETLLLYSTGGVPREPSPV